MTVLGKILVIVNLVFSLVTAGFIVTIYSTRTNWKAGLDEAKRQLKVVEADRATYAQRRDEADRSRDDAEKAKEKAAAELAKAKKEFEAQADALKKQIQTEYRNAQNADQNSRIAVAEAGQRQEEVRRLQGLLKERELAVVRLEQSNKDLRDQKVSFEIATRSEQERNAALAQQLEQLSKELERARTGGPSLLSPRAGAENPPSEEVQGHVKDIDTQYGYVTITIGSDHGLKEGNTLEVFRVQPEPKYLGIIRIVAVNPHEAVGKPVRAIRNGLIQKGDLVSNKIPTGR
jgi:hypothetical protein